MPTPIGRVITNLSLENPDAPAVTCEGLTVTRLQLERAANRLAHWYASLGVCQGDFVTIALPNGIEFFEVAIAVWKVGAIPQPVSARLPSRERESIISLAKPKLIVGVDPGSHPAAICIAQGSVPPENVTDAPIEPDRVSPAWKAPTSGGSTGVPKLIVSAETGEIDPSSAAGSGVREGGVVLIPGPLYHNMPFTASFRSLFYGNHVITMSKFDPVQALRAIDTYQVEVVNLVPTMMLRMWRVLEASPDDYSLSSLRVMWHMASPCPPWLKEAWIKRIGADKVMEMYGGTESQSLTAISGSEWLAHRGSVGRPIFGEIRIVDEDGRDLPPGEVGEIFMRAPSGVATYRYIGASAKEQDGWESLGDMGWLDEDGYLYISDRRTDMILSGGANIYPAEVENALMDHPQVAGVVVVGLPDDDLGQRVHAVVWAQGDVTGDDLSEFLADRLVRYKIPRSYRFVDEELRDDAGKVRRSSIREQETKLLAQGSP